MMFTAVARCLRQLPCNMQYVPCGFRLMHNQPSLEQTQAAFSYCVQQVQTYERENYVWMVQLPKELRRPLFALHAFNIDLALIGDQVQSKETPVVMIRFQWWRDAVNSLFSGQGAPLHPIVLALQTVLGQQKEQQTTAMIKRYNLKRIIDSREQDLLDAQPPLSIDGLEKYAEGTASQLLYLQLGAAGIASREADHAASHLGKAVGITTLLKGTAFHAQAKRSYLPLDLCAENEVSQEDVYSGIVTEGMRDVALQVATVAKGHLEEARTLQSKLPPSARPLFLSSLACDSYLKALEKSNFDLFDQSLSKGGISPLQHTLQIKWHLLAKSF